MACTSFAVRRLFAAFAGAVAAASFPIAPGVAAPLKVVVLDVEAAGLSASADLQRRLDAGTAIVRKLFGDRGFAVVDTSPQADKIKANLPLSQCNGCDQDIAKALGADLEVTVAVQSSTAVAFNINGSVKDVATNRVLRKGGVDVNGETADVWAHGFKFLAKERLLDPPLPADTGALRKTVDALPKPQE